jgi:methylmalonyl-CoA mutase
MIGLKNEFKSSSLEDWIVQLTKDLKGEDFSLLMRKDEIEEIEYSTFQHQESAEIYNQSPGQFPFTRGLNTTSNDWSNGFLIEVKNEQVANKKALEVLMKGCDLLLFDLSSSTNTNFKTLFEGIQFEYIKTQIVLANSDQFGDLKANFKGEIPTTITFNQDSNSFKSNTALSDVLVSELKQQQRFAIQINGFAIQQAGATTWQEIAYCLNEGHSAIVYLMENGLTIDEAAACVHFTVGIGSNYFFEIAKLRALKQNWASIIKAYEPAHNCSYNCVITAQIGFMNKSFKDPYTNLLRQTTETMSASSGGVHAIVVHPYDAYSSNGSSNLSERMALNMSLILKEESYFNQVIDPLGGSYAIEDLTSKIARKSWAYFQQLEQNGGFEKEQTKHHFIEQINQKAKLRLEELQTAAKIVIGVNKFPNPQEVKTNTFISKTSAFGLNSINFETELIAVK